MECVLSADDGCRLWTCPSGSGYPLVFCHGGPGLWDALIDVAALVPDPVRTIRWDQRGCGRSQRRGPYSVARSIADLDVVREHLAGPRTALLGHSWGATLALLYALEHPDRADRLIYVSGTGIDAGDGWKPAYHRNLRERLREHLPRWQALRDRALTPEEDREYAVLQWSADFAEPATAVAHAQRLATPWFGVNRECNAAIGADARRYTDDDDGRLRARCQALTMPVLIVDGARDIRPRSAVDSLYRALPDVRRVTLPRSGHLPWVEDPDGFREAVAGFLRLRQ